MKIDKATKFIKQGLVDNPAMLALWHSTLKEELETVLQREIPGWLHKDVESRVAGALTTQVFTWFFSIQPEIEDDV